MLSSLQRQLDEQRAKAAHEHKKVALERGAPNRVQYQLPAQLETLRKA